MKCLRIVTKEVQLYFRRERYVHFRRKSLSLRKKSWEELIKRKLFSQEQSIETGQFLSKSKSTMLIL